MLAVRSYNQTVVGSGIAIGTKDAVDVPAIARLPAPPHSIVLCQK
jgi:hypothetical protein